MCVVSQTSRQNYMQLYLQSSSRIVTVAVEVNIFALVGFELAMDTRNCSSFSAISSLRMSMSTSFCPINDLSACNVKAVLVSADCLKSVSLIAVTAESHNLKINLFLQSLIHLQ